MKKTNLASNPKTKSNKNSSQDESSLENLKDLKQQQRNDGILNYQINKIKKKSFNSLNTKNSKKHSKQNYFPTEEANNETLTDNNEDSYGHSFSSESSSFFSYLHSNSSFSIVKTDAKFLDEVKQIEKKKNVDDFKKFELDIVKDAQKSIYSVTKVNKFNSNFASLSSNSLICGNSKSAFYSSKSIISDAQKIDKFDNNDIVISNFRGSKVSNCFGKNNKSLFINKNEFFSEKNILGVEGKGNIDDNEYFRKQKKRNNCKKNNVKIVDDDLSYEDSLEFLERKRNRKNSNNTN